MDHDGARKIPTIDQKDEVKLVAAFLALNAGVIALAIAGQDKGETARAQFINT